MSLNFIHIISIPVSDQRRAKAFYVEKLGFELKMDVKNAFGEGIDWIALGLKGSPTALTLVTWFETMPAGSLRGLVIETDDIDAERARLDGVGVKIGAVQDAPWGRFASLMDSEGNELIIQKSNVIKQ